MKLFARLFASRRPLAFAALAVLAAIGVSACGSSKKEEKPAAETKASATSSTTEAAKSSEAAPTGHGTINVGNISSIANLGGTFNAFRAGVEAFFEYNNAKGGINGYKIHFTTIDDEGNPTKAAQAARTLVSEKVVAIVGEASLADAATQKYFESQGIPVIGGWATSSAWEAPSKNMFVSLQGPQKPLCASWSNETAKAMKVTKMAFIAQDFPDAIYDAECREAGAKAYGIQVVGKIITTSLTQTDYRPAIQQAMATGANGIYFSTGADGQIAGMEAGVQLGFKGLYIATQPAGLLKPLAPIASKLEGHVITSAFSLLPSEVSSAGVPELATAEEGIKKYQPQYASEITAVSGWAAGVLFAEALKHVGAEPSKITEYMQKLENFDFAGLQGPMSYTEGSHPNECTLPLVLEKDEWVRAPSAEPAPKFNCHSLVTLEGKEIKKISEIVK